MSLIAMGEAVGVCSYISIYSCVKIIKEQNGSVCIANMKIQVKL